jgi:hypothetical protein
MAVTKHGGDVAVDATESAFRGYALGEWPPMISGFCVAGGADRHSDCSLPGCTCACHPV